MREIMGQGELTRAELQARCEQKLSGPLEELKKLGIIVSLVAAPAKDPRDGKAVVVSTAENSREILDMLVQAAHRLHVGAAFALDKAKA